MPCGGSRACLFTLLVFFGLLASCGDGSGGTSTSSTAVLSSTPQGDFSISVSPTSVTLFSNASASLSVSVTASGGFSSTVTVTVSGLPSSVTASPASFAIAPGASQKVTFAATNSASGNITVEFNGVSGSLSHSATATLQIQSAVLNSRIQYVSTASGVYNAAYFGLGPVVIYNAAYKRFFFADPDQNLIFVFDAKTEKQLGTVSLPGGWLLDQAPDGARSMSER